MMRMSTTKMGMKPEARSIRYREGTDRTHRAPARLSLLLAVVVALGTFGCSSDSVTGPIPGLVIRGEVVAVASVGDHPDAFLGRLGPNEEGFRASIRLVNASASTVTVQGNSCLTATSISVRHVSTGVVHDLDPASACTAVIPDPVDIAPGDSLIWIDNAYAWSRLLPESTDPGSYSVRAQLSLVVPESDASVEVGAAEFGGFTGGD